MKYLIATLLLFSCSPNQPSTPSHSPSDSSTTTATSTSISSTTATSTSSQVPPSYPVKGWQYDNIVAANLTPVMLSSNPKDLCPNVAGRNKDFWISFVKSISFAESSWNRTSYLEESGLGEIDPITGDIIESDGLLQISYSDQLNYPQDQICKGMKYSVDKLLADRSLWTINDPNVNIGCGMQMMSSLLTRYPGDIVIALGKYWSTVRTATQGGLRMRAQLRIEAPWCYTDQIKRPRHVTRHR